MKTTKKQLLGMGVLASAALCSCQSQPEKPNIVLILADDFGLGDINRYYPDNHLITPHLDQLTCEGLNFTDAHSGSAVSTPTRYGLLTGRYAWRSDLHFHVLHQYDKPLINKEQLTIAEMLKEVGYRTACIGKWHLGHNWTHNKDGKGYDYTAPLTGGAVDQGFDYYFGTDVPNFDPYTFIENRNIYVQPTDTMPGDVVPFIPKGPCAPGWKFEEILPTITQRACNYIKENATKEGPFFLYFPLTSPHEPIAPSAAFKGKSEHIMKDFLHETDWSVGEIMKAIDEAGIAENTILIFAGDNGASNYTYRVEMEKIGIRRSGIYRDYKASIYEGGHRVPLIIRWPGVTKPDSYTDQLTCHNDIFATLAENFGYTIPENQAPDSESFLPLLQGDSTHAALRHQIIHHDVAGRFAFRDGAWKLVCLPYKASPTEWAVHYELYNLQDDPRESKDLAAQYPDKVQTMSQTLETQIQNGRSTPGASLSNAGEVTYREMPAEYMTRPHEYVPF